MSELLCLTQSPSLYRAFDKRRTNENLLQGVVFVHARSWRSLCLCCHCLLTIHLWVWKLCGSKVNKVELCQLTLLLAERMWQNWSQNPDNTNCSSTLELWAVMANSTPPSPASQQPVAIFFWGGGREGLGWERDTACHAFSGYTKEL